jgi:hypothetical protein
LICSYDTRKESDHKTKNDDDQADFYEPLEQVAGKAFSKLVSRNWITLASIGSFEDRDDAVRSPVLPGCCFGRLGELDKILALVVMAIAKDLLSHA